MKRFFFLFKLYFLIYILLAFNAFVNETVWMHYAAVLLIVGGIAVLVCMLIKFTLYRKVWNIWLIAAFLGSYALSSLLTWHYGFTDNIKEMIWLALAMVALYASSYVYTAEERKQEFQIIAAVYVAVCTFFNVVSNSMILWGREFGISVTTDGQVAGYKVVGFKWGRLWGMYDDPNHGATITVVAILLTLYLMQIAKKRFVKIILALTLVVHFCYVMLSDSRTGLVALGTGVFVWTAVQSYFHWKEKGWTLRRSAAISVLIGLLLAVGLIGTAYGCKKQYNVLDKKLEVILPKIFPNRNTGKKQVSGQIGRKQDLKSDATNGRLDIWESGLEITETSPVCGVSFRNMTAYAEENLPETYLVHNPENAKYDSLHNSVMDILVSQGLIGIVIFLFLIGNTIRLMKKKIYAIRGENREFLTVCFAVMAAMGIGSLFLSMVFYLNAPQTYVFWLCFGYFVGMLGEGDTVS